MREWDDCYGYLWIIPPFPTFRTSKKIGHKSSKYQTSKVACPYWIRDCRLPNFTQIHNSPWYLCYITKIWLWKWVYQILCYTTLYHQTFCHENYTRYHQTSHVWRRPRHPNRQLWYTEFHGHHQRTLAEVSQSSALFLLWLRHSFHSQLCNSSYMCFLFDDCGSKSSSSSQNVCVCVCWNHRHSMAISGT